MRLKVLPIEFWMRRKYHEGDFVEQLPTYHREGQYLLGEHWWFEIDDQAFVYRDPRAQARAADQFKYRLEVSDEAILNARELDSITTILNVSRNAALKHEALELWRRHDQARSIRDTRRTIHGHFRKRHSQ